MPGFSVGNPAIAAATAAGALGEEEEEEREAVERLGPDQLRILGKENEGMLAHLKMRCGKFSAGCHCYPPVPHTNKHHQDCC